MKALTPETLNNLHHTERVRDFGEMGQIIHKLKHDGADVILTQGAFDWTHLGHVGYLRAAQVIGDNVVVVTGVENDESIAHNKGQGRPINKTHERLNMLSEWRATSLVFAYPDVPDYDTMDDFISRYRELRPTGIAVSSQDPHLDLKREQARRSGTQIVPISYWYENSTTIMLREIGYEE